MTQPAHDLSRLAIDRDRPPPPVRRAPEIAALLTLGFSPRSVLASFLAEATAISLLGGVLGCLLLAGLVFAAVMGGLGGVFPTRRGSRLPVVQAPR